MIEVIKACSVCSVAKPMSEFHRNKSNPDGHTYQCKSCEKAKRAARYLRDRELILERNRAWRAANKEKDLEARRNYYAKNREAARIRGRANRLRTRYGITPEDYDSMFLEQSGACAICGDAPAEGDPLHVDHDHDTGAVRGLLCNACNFGIGFLKDSPELLSSAITYLTGERP